MSEFVNPVKALEKIKEERRYRDSLPAKHPKINTIFDKMKYDHKNPVLGYSIGMEEKQAIVLADKFAKAEAEARAISHEGFPSRTLEILMPQLTPEELVFCASHILSEKLRFTGGL
jgi:hypothetical protein